MSGPKRRIHGSRFIGKVWEKMVCVLAPFFLPFLLLLVSYWQSHLARPDLEGYVLHFGRLVYAPGQKGVDPDFDKGQLHRLFDGNPESAAVLNYPAETGEPTYFLAELGLSHGAPSNPKGRPRPLFPESLVLYNGRCWKCPAKHFQKYGRLKRIRLEILYRQANNADREYLFPPVRTVFSKEYLLEDRPGPFVMSLRDLPRPKVSSGWPRNMDYIIAKIIILEVYPARAFRRNPVQKLAIAELVYKDHF